MPLVESKYQSPWYFKNPHLATVIPSTLRKVHGVEYERERINTRDNDFLDLDWVKNDSNNLVIISHGLEGSADRPYMLGMAKYFKEKGWDALSWNCRSCSGEMNLKPRFYHHAASEDLEDVVDHVVKHNSYEHIAFVGFSMGGSLTLKYLGDKRDNAREEIIGGAVFSVPVSLKSSVDALSLKGRGFYRKRFLKKLELKIRKKAVSHPEKIKLIDFRKVKLFQDFDNVYTAPLHGFKDAEDFYKTASVNNYMWSVQKPVLLVNAINDPFLGEECYPYKRCEDHQYIHFESPEHGGHVGFGLQGSSHNYMEERAFEFISGLL